MDGPGLTLELSPAPGTPSYTDRLQQPSKNRPSSSCTLCRRRKVKCDRVFPCRACCLRGTPSECEYAVGDAGRLYVTQADAIEALQLELASVKRQLANLKNARGDTSTTPTSEVATELDSQPITRSTSAPQPPMVSLPPTPLPALRQKCFVLRTIYCTISGAPSEVAYRTVAQIRERVPIDLILASIRASHWTGSDTSSAKRPIKHESFGRDDSPPRKLRRSGAITSPAMGIDEERKNDFSENNSGCMGTQYVVRAGMWSFPPQNKAGSETQYYQPDDGTPIRFFRDANRPFLEVFVERFIDAFSPEPTGYKSNMALRAAACARTTMPLLNSAFDAVSIMFAGESLNKTKLVEAGERLYVKVLNDLQQALYNPKESCSLAVLGTVGLLMVFESLQCGKANAVVQHMHAILALLQHRGPRSHTVGIEHNFFVELRSFWVMTALSSRAPSFLADQDWKIIPWSGGGSTKNLLQHLLDIVVEVPAYLCAYDTFIDLLRRHAIPPVDAVARHQMLCRQISCLQARLSFWKRDWADQYTFGQPKEADMYEPESGSEAFPSFQCHDLQTMTSVQPKPIVYPDALLAQSICTYYATLLVLSGSDRRGPGNGAIPIEQRYAWACQICRSVEFFVRTVKSPLVMRFIFVLRIAYDTFDEGTMERDFVKRVFVWISMRYQLKSFLGMVPEISVSRNANKLVQTVDTDRQLVIPP